MVKALLCVALLATQVLSWNAAPLYVCLGPDGSFCVDFGPASCGCCRLDAANSDCCAAAHADEHEHGDIDPCGCNHIQVSEPQSATLVRTTLVVDSQRFAGPQAAAINSADAGRVFATSWPTLSFRSIDLPSAALAELSSVVLRC